MQNGGVRGCLLLVACCLLITLISFLWCISRLVAMLHVVVVRNKKK
jgi:hypothetical protein